MKGTTVYLAGGMVSDRLIRVTWARLMMTPRPSVYAGPRSTRTHSYTVYKTTRSQPTILLCNDDVALDTHLFFPIFICRS